MLAPPSSQKSRGRVVSARRVHRCGRRRQHRLRHQRQMSVPESVNVESGTGTNCQE